VEGDEEVIRQYVFYNFNNTDIRKTAINIPRLARIRVHPVKSLESVEVDSARLFTHGMLEHDRSFAVFEGNGEIIKAKSNPELHRLHATFDIESLSANFRVTGDSTEHSFHLENDRVAINQWLSQVFNRPIVLHRDESFGFADDWTATGPTLISTATIETIASWYDELSVDDIRQRLRANLEIDGVPAFWEDQLYGPEVGDLVRFKIGTVELFGKNACQRCPVPARDVETGDILRTFARTFIKQRNSTLPDWAHPGRFDTFYRTAINTLPALIADDSKLKVGDMLDIIGPEKLA